MSARDTYRLLSALIGDVDEGPPSLGTLCRRTAALIRVTGVSMALMGEGPSQSATSSFGGAAKALQDLEFTLGEGPGTAAHAEGRSVLIDQIETAAGRWPLFTSAALDLGVWAVYALPLQLGAIKLGVLVLYCQEPGAMSATDLADAAIVADLLTKLVLTVQSATAGEALAWALDLSDHRAVVHQATGMVAAQLNCGVDEALVRLRGHAFATDRPIEEVAGEVVGGSLRFDVM